MPPRLSLLSRLRALDLSACSVPTPLSRTTSACIPCPRNEIQTRSISALEKKKRRMKDPYILAQMRAKKAANESRQEQIQKARAEAMGDPVRGKTTPFIESLDTAFPSSPPNPAGNISRTTSAPDPNVPPPGPDALNEATPSTGTPETTPQTRLDPSKLVDLGTPHPSLPLKHFLTRDELASALERSRNMSEPVVVETNDALAQTENEAALRRHAEEDAKAQQALRRIVSLASGSNKDRLRANVTRCISEFGRHETDTVLPPRPHGSLGMGQGQQEGVPPRPRLKERAGPDTGSSEVQIAILTARIRVLADAQDTRGRKDKVNKRNLRLLVHRRQKLLRYLRRKERGGPRWQHCIEKLGLTEGTWQGEISL